MLEIWFRLKCIYNRMRTNSFGHRYLSNPRRIFSILLVGYFLLFGSFLGQAHDYPHIFSSATSAENPDDCGHDESCPTHHHSSSCQLCKTDGQFFALASALLSDLRPTSVDKTKIVISAKIYPLPLRDISLRSPPVTLS